MNTSGRDGAYTAVVAFVLDISVRVRPRGESSVAGDPAAWTL